jgi:GT2 family glycosyltransferase
MSDQSMKNDGIPTLPNIEIAEQLLSSANFYLAKDARRSEGPNIGAAGEHLTIAFLSLNRTHLAERLCKSIAEIIPQFKGEVLAVDNGSDAGELKRLREMLETMPFRSRLVELGRNFGVAGGRNKTIPYVATPWLMCLDDDIFFIANPLKRIQSDLARLGCKFLTLSFLGPDRKKLLTNGAVLNVVIENGETSVLCDSAYECGETHELDGSGFLSSMMCGGACVFEVETFRAAGQYDENIFVGFEDIDLSIRLFRGGY